MREREREKNTYLSDANDRTAKTTNIQLIITTHLAEITTYKSIAIYFINFLLLFLNK